jgi:hypothetical protein
MGKADPNYYRTVDGVRWLSDVGMRRAFQVANGVRLEKQEYHVLEKVCASGGMRIDGASVVFLASRGWIGYQRGPGLYVATKAGQELIHLAKNEADRLLERVRREEQV